MVAAWFFPKEGDKKPHPRPAPPVATHGLPCRPSGASWSPSPQSAEVKTGKGEIVRDRPGRQVVVGRLTGDTRIPLGQPTAPMPGDPTGIMLRSGNILRLVSAGPLAETQHFRFRTVSRLLQYRLEDVKEVGAVICSSNQWY